MALPDSNTGTQYYAASCGVPSASGINLNSNKGTVYYYISANDYILWGQPTRYTHITANSGSNYYFYQCGVSSEPGLNLQSNAGTHYYYSSAFNCVPWCS
jgi:hypothetical protein